jgi:hypothetical protein
MMKKIQKLKLSPIVNFDKATNQFEILLNEVGIHGIGKSKQEAVNSLVDVVTSSTIEFFYNFELYFDSPELRRKYPYFLSFGRCKTKDDLLRVLNIEA